MVLEELLYLQNSKFLESAIILQPELTKSKNFKNIEEFIVGIFQ